MITAFQDIKLKAANNLKQVSDLIFECRNYTFLEQEDIDRLHEIKEEIDSLFKKIISNE